MKVTFVTPTFPRCHRDLLLGGENAEGFHLKFVDLLNRPFYDHEASAKGYCLESICCLADDDQANLVDFAILLGIYVYVHTNDVPEQNCMKDIAVFNSKFCTNMSK